MQKLVRGCSQGVRKSKSTKNPHTREMYSLNAVNIIVKITNVVPCMVDIILGHDKIVWNNKHRFH